MNRCRNECLFSISFVQVHANAHSTLKNKKETKLQTTKRKDSVIIIALDLSFFLHIVILSTYLPISLSYTIILCACCANRQTHTIHHSSYHFTPHTHALNMSNWRRRRRNMKQKSSATTNTYYIHKRKKRGRRHTSVLPF